MDDPTKPQTEEQRQRLREFLHDNWLLSLNAAIRHGASPVDAATAMLGAGANAMLDMVPRAEVIAVLKRIVANVEATSERPIN